MGKRSIPIPKRKKDWPGHLLLLDGPCPEGRVTAPVVRITRRLNAMDTHNSGHDVMSKWGNVRILKVFWECPHCGAGHSGYLPERLIEEGKALFVEEEQHGSKN